MTEATVDDIAPDAAEERVARQRTDLFARLRKTPTCMLITRDVDGRMHVRPMTTQRADEDGILWMFIAADSELAGEVAANPDVLITYADTGDSAYVVVRGHATVLRDPEKAKEMWSKLAEAWFPGGHDDPNLALLRITMSSAEQWEPPAGKVMQFLEIAAAALTHKNPDHDGAYRKLHF
jgi:general stress protein 26